MNKNKLLGLILILAISIPLSAQNKDNSLRSLIEQAEKMNPNLSMLQTKLEAAMENIQVGTHLPDPVATLGFIGVPTNTFSLNQEAMTGKVLGVTQPLPFPGSLKAKAAVKSMDTLIIRQQIEDVTNQIREQVSELYYSLQENRKDVQLTRESLDLLKQISLVAKRKFEVGTASLQNVIEVEVQKTHLQDKIEALNGEEMALQAQLNGLLLQSDSIYIPTEKILPISGQNFQTEELLNMAEKNRPVLKEIKLNETKAGLMEKEARYAFYPNFKVGVQYTQRTFNDATGMNYPDLLGVLVGVTIPINYGGNKTAQVNSARYQQDAYKQQYQFSLQVLQQHFGAINAQLKSLKNREKLLSSTLLPQAIQSYQAALADYQVNKIDFVNVMKAEDQILKIKTELANIRTSYSKNLSKLEFLSGTQLN
ncbi:MAG: TolC family protein [Bacteroidales bacterium]|nr:TolC family protein [Bacteroidales bacterium]